MTHTPGRTTPALDIVVCTCDPSRLPLLRACLDAVQRGIGPRDTLTVVVDHCPQLLTRLSPPTGEAGETGADGAAPPVTVVENTRTRGLSGARNTGLTVGGNPVVCFLDDDAVPSRLVRGSTWSVRRSRRHRCRRQGRAEVHRPRRGGDPSPPVDTGVL